MDSLISRVLRAVRRVSSLATAFVRKSRSALYILQTQGPRGISINLRNKLERRRRMYRPRLVAHELPRPLANYPPLRFPVVDTPEVSIVIAACDHFHLTYSCLRSLVALVDEVRFEVIVVDDASSDRTVEISDIVSGAKIIRNSTNRGFIHSCNRGALEAGGDDLLFLNNDTLVKQGAIRALIEASRGGERIGMVGAKLLYPDGRLQEAGGIVWRDGSASNYGRMDDPQRPEYSYLREVDYCSGACLLIPRALFLRVGMFDSRYSPAYYEDVDLAFAVRRAGLRVLYQPGAEICHFEGASLGSSVEEGQKRYQVINQEKFHSKWAFELRSCQPKGAPAEDARERAAGKRVLVAYARTVMPDHDAGSLRMYRMLKILIERGYRVDFFPDDSLRAGHYTEALQRMGVHCLYAPYEPSLEKYLSSNRGKIDVAILAQFDVARKYLLPLGKHCPEARIVFDTVDLHFLRESREMELKGHRVGGALLRRKREELDVVRQSDVTVVVSDVERELLKADCVETAVEVLPTIHDLNLTKTAFADREGIVFIGGFEHPPNVDAIEYYATEVLPLLRERRPDLSLTVIGADAPVKLKRHESDAVHFVGQVSDLKPLFERCRLSIAPVRFGAGVKGKVLTSMSFGVPVVTTTIGAEGLGVENGRELLIRDDAEGFAEGICQLYGDGDLWAQLASAGLRRIEEGFSSQAAERALLHIVEGRET